MLQKSFILTSNLCKNLFVLSPTVLRKMSSVADDVIFDNVGDKGVITLNRPKALNALNLSMVNKLYPTLVQWESEKSLVIIKGAGGKAFCAGGDVKSIALAGMKGEKLGHAFFKQEYKTDGLIGTYKVPYIAFIDGIVMGGGVGLSVHGPYRVATERSVFAMPETQIGLFPDVGGSYFLPRLRGKLGLFLALTGYRLKGVDLLKAGIATHYVDSQCLEALEGDLLKCGDSRSIDSTLSKYSTKDNSEFSLEPMMKQINNCFSAGSVEEIIGRLEKDGSQFALEMVKLLGKMSPTSLKVTMKQLEYGSKMTLEECLQMEYRIAVNCLANKDFYEGVRALLIDKDQNPKWSPSKLAEVSSALVESHFAKLPEDQELRNKL
ncbi:3-hydroxyisobutyryl-CoA hydrolase, mitochondrial isoform X1 [Tribolium castaneum]|uniref:3-hydroxyisobutyryl-CoA hydrolase, mitochondrial n=2 Tax=Tribolium castaneum TaxID=7070 RepID=D6X3R7_TRICA|nr:PREDICTED: 3-hydroxyisobutyryl-CoA hydrolase, mitochondrial isoform X1 [Tribolium castaneum]EEZ97382.1 3-hydroxyisobutyryl-CoA hydrolase, mitochondrial-like Protein [Tribolium castaneum]|eukprot:XP_968873.1 PREDICTED: 3-hydroxyisobutyryl-CoA hydrolase, mitochondrial isoform X1 [Tribolium castaneum]